MSVLLSMLLDVVVAAVAPGRRTSRALADPSLWRGPDLSPWTVAAAVAVFLPLVPLFLAVTRFVVAAWRLAEDPMLFFVGLLIAIPAAVTAFAVLSLAGAAAAWVAAGLLAGRMHARTYATTYGILTLGCAGLFLLAELWAYGFSMAAASVVLLGLLLRR